MKSQIIHDSLHISGVKATSPAVCILSEALATCLYRPQSHVAQGRFQYGTFRSAVAYLQAHFIPCSLLISRLEGSRWEPWREVGSQRNPRMGYFLPEQMNQCLREVSEASLSEGAGDSVEGFDGWKMKTLLIDLQPESSKLSCLFAPRSAAWGHCWGILGPPPHLPHTFWGPPGFLYSNSLG